MNGAPEGAVKKTGRKQRMANGRFRGKAEGWLLDQRQLKTTPSRLYIWFCTLFYLIENNFYKIIKLDGTLQKYLLLGLSLAAFVLFFADAGLFGTAKRASRFMQRVLLPGVVFFLLAEFLYARVHYGQGVSDFLAASYHYCYLFLSPMLLYIFDRQGGFRPLMDRLTTLVCVGLALSILNTLIYNVSGVMLLEVSYRLRDESLRTYGLSSVLGIECVYTFWRLMKGHSKKGQLIEAAIVAVSIVYCYRTRMMEISMAVIAVYLFLRRSKSSGRRVIAALAVMFGVVLAAFFGLFDRVLDSFAVGGAHSGSTSTRLNEIAYYLEELRQSPVFGIGLLATRTTLGFYRVRGPLGRYSITDVGLIGSTGLMGVPYLILTGVFLLRGLYILRHLRNTRIKDYPAAVLLETLMVYIISTLPTLIITDSGRMFGLVIVTALFEYVYAREKGRAPERGRA